MTHSERRLARVHTRERYLWPVAFVVLMALAIPWFMWGVDTVVAGLPIWLWWHVGWMALTAVVFYLFARRAWGLGVAESGGGDVAESGSDVTQTGGGSA